MNAAIHDADDKKGDGETCYEHQRTTITLPRGVKIDQVHSCDYHRVTPSREDHYVVPREGTHAVLNGPADGEVTFDTYRHEIRYRCHRAEYIKRLIKDGNRHAWLDTRVERRTGKVKKNIKTNQHKTVDKWSSSRKADFKIYLCKREWSMVKQPV
ncbi:hypothetical protein ACROYT_G039876 [Oculina patagonica]